MGGERLPRSLKVFCAVMIASCEHTYQFRLPKIGHLSQSKTFLMKTPASPNFVSAEGFLQFDSQPFVGAGRGSENTST